jgi:hypothetical protein
MATKKRSSTLGRVLARYFGWVTVAIALAVWGKVDPTVTILLALTGALYTAFRTPTWCGAITRRRMVCRNNAQGVLMGCHLREHKWQKLRLAVIPKAWSSLWNWMWRTDKMQTATLAVTGLGVIFGGFEALGTFVAPALSH